MVKRDETGMWNVVMFDLPVKTREQRRAATQFRHLLLDLGWQMHQFSVYVRYVPTGMSVVPEVMQMKRGIPAQGKVEIVGVTDRQWAKAFRYVNQTETASVPQPESLTLF